MSKRQTRNVSLTPELDRFIDDSLTAGDYGSASALIREAVRLLRDNGSVAARPVSVQTWPIAGGACGALIRSHPWSKTSLGPIEGWSPYLRATVNNIVNSPVPSVLMWGSDYVMIYNDGYGEIAGANHPAALGGTVAGIWPEVWDFNRAILEAGFRGEVRSYRNQWITLHRNGAPEQVILDLFYTPVHDASGQIGGVMCTVIENTEKVAAERRLAQSEAQLRTVTNALPVLISYVDSGHIYRFANSFYKNWLGLEAGAVVGRHMRDVLGERHYAERLPMIERALAGEHVVSDTMMPHRDGPDRASETRYIPHVEADGAVAGFHVLVFDIQERVRREQAVRSSNGRFRAAMDAIDGVLWTNSADGRMLGEQPGWSALTGQAFDAYQNFGWADAVHPEDREQVVELWKQAIVARKTFFGEHRVLRQDGVWRRFSVRAVPIFEETGAITEWVGVNTDITEQRAAEQALREHSEALERQIRHRRRAEEQLRQFNETLEIRVIEEIAERRQAEAALAQAQKMETIGKLTGGVAHDFNNLLQVVSGNLQLLAKDIAGNDRAERRVGNAMAGVSRGAKLAGQLLAFGRRQPLEPKVVNVTRFVRGMDDMLRRAIGEGIEVETIVGGGLWNTFVDPAQIENALLNLAINARDAMDGQGRLTIELGNASLDDGYARVHAEVSPGQYVMLAVSDTGCGMSQDVIEKVFEPFFSTKSEGKGSGLGLSMVYGFVKQSGGHVKIYSEVGYGTTIKLYLPRALQSEDVEVETGSGPIAGGSETVLVVEDDAEVRATVVEMLTDLGYRVLKAVDAQSGLNVIESGIPIDILFTDVVMPGSLKSPELARKARERLPDIAVLFTSGYTENSIVHGGKLDAGVSLLSKPYTREALARKFRHVLANQQQRARATATPPVAPPALPSDRRPTVLLVEDDELIRMNTAEMLQETGAIVVEAGSAEDAMVALQTASIDVLVTDVNLPGLSGPELARQARDLIPAIGVVFATGDSTIATPPDDPRMVLLVKPYDYTALSKALEIALGSRSMAVDAGPVRL